MNFPSGNHVDMYNCVGVHSSSSRHYVDIRYTRFPVNRLRHQTSGESCRYTQFPVMGHRYNIIGEVCRYTRELTGESFIFL